MIGIRLVASFQLLQVSGRVPFLYRAEILEAVFQPPAVLGALLRWTGCLTSYGLGREGVSARRRVSD